MNSRQKKKKQPLTLRDLKSIINSIFANFLFIFILFSKQLINFKIAKVKEINEKKKPL